MKRILVTSALPYANGYVHLGHVAGSFLPADLFVRHMRLLRMPVLYVCGSDENGAAIAIAADQEGVTPKEIADKYHTANAAALAELGLSFDIYSRTTNPGHVATTQEFFSDFLAKDLLVEQEEEQFFDDEFQKFLPDRFVEGTCPNCGFEHARSDECDNCLAKYEPLELRKPVSKLSGKTPVLRKTTHWYFRFGKFQEYLQAYIDKHKPEWKDNVIQQSQSWLNAGLNNRPVTRDLSWGVPVPLEAAKGKVIYVWFEALLGYITATKEWAAAQGQPESWKDWWQNPETEYSAFLGKDNIWFHTLMFPAMLHARGGYILPSNVPANEFLNLEGRKFSKSRNWGINLREYFEDFPEERDVDALRYALALSTPETKDADFTWKDFQARVNNELADKLGNFVNRTLKFLESYFDGAIPAPSEDVASFDSKWEQIRQTALTDDSQTGDATINIPAGFSADEVQVIQAFACGMQLISQKYRKYRFRDAVGETMRLTEAANKYFNDRQPWKSRKTDMQATGLTLYVCAQLVRSLAIAFAPVIPGAANKMLAFLGQDMSGVNWSDIGSIAVAPGTKVKPYDILFAKIEDAVIEAQVNKLLERSRAAEETQAAEVQMKYQDLPEAIEFDSFTKMALRVGTIVLAEKIKKSNKLLRLEVNLGFEKRQIVAGIAKHYKPETLVGKKVLVLANLKPAKLLGVESQGMVLCAEDANGRLTIVAPDASMPDGATVR